MSDWSHESDGFSTAKAVRLVEQAAREDAAMQSYLADLLERIRAFTGTPEGEVAAPIIDEILNAWSVASDGRRNEMAAMLEVQQQYVVVLALLQRVLLTPNLSISESLTDDIRSFFEDALDQ